MNETELRDGLAYVAAELRTIHESAGDAPLDADTQARFDAGTAYVTETRAAITAIETRRAQVAELATIPANVERGAPEPTTERTRRDVPNVNLNRDIFDMSTVDRSDPKRTSAEFRARAIAVAEDHAPSWVTDAYRESATRTAEKRSNRNYDADLVNEHIVRTSTEGYIESFEDFANTGGKVVRGEFKDYNESRAAMSLTAANGGLLVPQWLDPTIILTNAGSDNDVRANARVEQITVDQADFVTSAGVTAEWLAEATEVADASPTFVGPTITPQKRAAWLYGSFEMIADSGFDQIAPLIADAFDRQEETAFATGHNGSGSPYGLVTRLSGTGPTVAGSSGAAGAADLVVADIYALDNALGPRWRKNAKFMAAKKTYNSIRQLNNSSAMSTFWVDFGGGLPAQLIGYDVLRNEAFDTTVVSGSNDDVVLLGDLKSGYIICDRVGTTIMYEGLVKGSNQRPTGQAGWFAFGRVGADVVTSNAFKLLRL